MLSTLALIGVILTADAIGASSPHGHHEIPKAPSFVLDFAPLIALDQNEIFFPSDIAQQLVHTVPEVNFTRVDRSAHLTLDNLNGLNKFGNTSVFLTSKDDVTDLAREPSWVHGVKPNGRGETKITPSPMLFTFTSMPSTMADTLPEFRKTSMLLTGSTPWSDSHTEGGEAFSYNALQKIGKRALVFSAFGSHANYATKGSHNIPFVIPPLPAINLSSISIPGIPSGVLDNLNLSAILQVVVSLTPLQDKTSMGPLWDPVANAFAYNYTFDFNRHRAAEENNRFAPLATTSHADPPTNWLTYFGQWGDEQYPLTDVRQYEILNIPSLAYFQSGPNGPVFKHLIRSTVCPPGVSCTHLTKFPFRPLRPWLAC
ncbi:hypothetical protein BBK36DRAFT_1202546 [Trichoderma citrinoviride]|uniref:Uncharacterized protein n=1 Tax=Trichoderma citrinoviride TaxID=58853 RepID=A0A2T4B944_9HYPO|nr:hypothetical protein BBK36DRAFT_1202546 [Trichoderma citrinoviride]PTB65739.1 hypothetical protein BBK36DRAFT_1202546 [Trichoderma citrinoviride]